MTTTTIAAEAGEAGRHTIDLLLETEIETDQEDLPGTRRQLRHLDQLDSLLEDLRARSSASMAIRAER